MEGGGCHSLSQPVGQVRCAVTPERETVSVEVSRVPRREWEGEVGLRGRGVPRREWKWKGGGEEELSPAANGRCCDRCGAVTHPRERNCLALALGAAPGGVPRREWKGGEEEEPSPAANGRGAGGGSASALVLTGPGSGCHKV